MDKQPTKKILVTSALPYANGPIHLGHLLEHIQTDIWVRFQRMQGRICLAICGEDAHGTAIMIKAQQQGITPEALIRTVKIDHEADFKDFHIHYDNYYTTHSKENHALASEIYLKLKARGDIIVKKINQSFDPIKNLFLPDRYVKGECPACHAPDQYGDNCENCGATYLPTDLIDPRSVLSGAPPIQKTSEHYFFKLKHYEDFLKTWSRADHLQQAVIHKLDEWLQTGLKDWDISRDEPYFGFEIPDAPGKYFYVWLDAPIGYMASFKAFCNRNSEFNFDEFWRQDSQTELYHFVGKDIIYFHALFWPALLTGAGLRTPTAIFTHGYVTVDGQKMSKSRGTFIKARTYLKHLNPEYLRYYYAAKLSNGIEDIDLNFTDFLYRVNADLVGKVVNLACRCAKFINDYFDNQLSANCIDTQLYQTFVDAGNDIARLYENREYSRAVRHIMALADRANQYIDKQKPWQQIKDETCPTLAQDVCSLGLNLFCLIMTYLKPILPHMAEQTETFLQIPPMDWENRKTPWLNHTIGLFTPLMTRITQAQIETMKQTANETSNSQQESTKIESNAPHQQEQQAMIDIDTFNKIDLRVAKIVSADYVKGADKLLKLGLDLGQEKRQVFAGIKAAYTPEDLIGKLTVVVANLKPRKMRFGLSEGMVLAAGPGGDTLWLVSPDAGAKPGMRVK